MRAGLLMGLVFSLFSPSVLAVMPELEEEVVFSCEGHVVVSKAGAVAKASLRYSWVGLGDKMAPYIFITTEAVEASAAQTLAYFPDVFSHYKMELAANRGSFVTLKAYLTYENDEPVDDVSKQALVEIHDQATGGDFVRLAFAGQVATFSKCKSEDDSISMGLF